jgi:hypothetical protein
MEYYKNKYLKYKSKYLDTIGGDFKPKHIPKTKDMFANIDKYNEFMKKINSSDYSKTQKQRGGVITEQERDEFEKLEIEKIGVGKYGCVYAPSMPCKNSSGENVSAIPNTIGKLMTHEDAQVEAKNWDLIKNIPNIEKYVATYYETCKPTELSMEQIKTKMYLCDADRVKKELAKEQIAENEPNLDILIYENAGYDNLDKQIIQNITYPFFYGFMNFLAKFKNIMDGVRELNNRGIIHGDIKMGNIQVKNDTYKLIDFGRAFRLDDPDFIAYIDINIPFEIMLITPIVGMDKSPETYERVIRNLIKYIHENTLTPRTNIVPLNYLNKQSQENIQSSVPKINYPIYFSPITYIQNTEANIKNYIAYIHRLKESFNKENGYTKRQLANKIDVYSLGMVLLTVVHYFRVFAYDTEKHKYTVDNIFIPRECNEIFMYMYSLIYKMTDFNIDSRLSINDACERYNRLCEKLHIT